MFEQYGKGNIKRIFLIRSSAKLFPCVVDELRKTFPEASISCLSAERGDSTRSSLQYDVDHVISTPHKGGFLWRDIPKVRLMLKHHSYDCSIVLYNSEKGYGYLNIDAFAYAARPKLILSVNIKKEVRGINNKILIYKFLHRIIDLFWASLNIVFTILVLIIICLVMLLSVPFVQFRSCVENCVKR